MEKISKILDLDQGMMRTAALAHWVQGLYRRKKDRPVLVGGAAVELLTGGAFTTRDLDLAGIMTAAVDGALKAAGFSREGRHWFHEEKHLILKFPSRALNADEETRERDFAGIPVLIICAEDLIVDRLSAWVRWKSPMDGISAYLLYRALEAELDMRKLENRAAGEEVHTDLLSVREFFVTNGGNVPDDKVVEAWARREPG
ncbi:MAG: hypothetical protein PVJ01_06380 [Pseudomonadota bacterium]|jgi:hypothetical protein